MSDQHGQTLALMPEPMEKAPAQPATPAPRRRSLARGPGCRSSTFASCAAFRLHPDETAVAKFRRNCANASSVKARLTLLTVNSSSRVDTRDHAWISQT